MFGYITPDKPDLRICEFEVSEGITVVFARVLENKPGIGENYPNL